MNAISKVAFVVAMATCLGLFPGCATQRHGEREPNFAGPEEYTRDDAISAGRHLVSNLLQDPAFAEHYDKKKNQTGRSPSLSVENIENYSNSRNAFKVLRALRGEIESILLESGLFVLASDSFGGDYRLSGIYDVYRVGKRFEHRVSMKLIDPASGQLLWCDDDEVVKE